MKGAILISKDLDFFRCFVSHLKTLGHEYAESTNSLRLTKDDQSYFLLYDRTPEESFYEKYENPIEIAERGYRYAYMVECRDETLFCDIVKSAASKMDFFVCDSDGAVFRPEQVDPYLISL